MRKFLDKRWIPLFLFTLIMIIGLLLRSKPYFSGNFNYFLDQSRDLLLTKQIVVDHNITLIGARAGIGGVFHGPVWLYMIAPFFWLAKGDPFYTLIPLFTIINLLPILIAYLAGSKLYDKTTGLIWSLLIAISSTLIDPSFITSNAQVMPIVFLLYLSQIILYFRGKEIALAYAMFFVGLGFQFESAFAVFLIPLTIWGLIVYRKLPKLKTLLMGIILFMLSVANFIIFEIRHKFLMSNSVLKLFDGSIEHFSDYKHLAKIEYRIYDRLLGLKNYFFTTLFQDNLFVNLIVVIILLSAIVILTIKIKNKKQLDNQIKEYLFIFSIPILYYSLYVLYPYPLWGQYTLSLPISASLLLAFSIKIIYSHLHNKLLLGLCMLLIASPALLWTYNNYFGSQANTPTFRSYKEQKDVAEYIFKDNLSKNKIGYFVYDSGSLTYNMDYLMWYFGNKYNVEVVNEKLPITYLILNTPPKWNPGADKYWIENVINTNGDVLSRNKFVNGMTVEKRAITGAESPVDANYFQNLIFR